MRHFTNEIKGKTVCVVGGAGSIGSSFIKALLRFEPASAVLVTAYVAFMKKNYHLHDEYLASLKK